MRNFSTFATKCHVLQPGSTIRSYWFKAKIFVFPVRECSHVHAACVCGVLLIFIPGRVCACSGLRPAGAILSARLSRHRPAGVHSQLRHGRRRIYHLRACRARTCDVMNLFPSAQPPHNPLN